MDKKEEIEQLKKQIEYHNNRYYNLDSPEISDYDYDMLYARLKELEKELGVSYKERAAILPAGHSANAAYWLDNKNRQFITSTYYMQQLPQWAKDYNKVLAKNEEFKKVGEDVGLYPLTGHITADMAIAALEGEQLGLGAETDMLCISFSQTDVIGHKWGTRGEHADERAGRGAGRGGGPGPVRIQGKNGRRAGDHLGKPGDRERAGDQGIFQNGGQRLQDAAGAVSGVCDNTGGTVKWRE